MPMPQLSQQKYAKFRSLSVAGLILAAILLIPAFGLAQPDAAPPGGTVNARFDTVTADNGYFVGNDETYPTVYGQLTHDGGGTGFKINANAGGGTWADMLFQTNGVTRMFLESAGLVGINTVTPSAQLEVMPNGSRPTLELGRVGGQPSIKAESDGYMIIDSDERYLSLNHYENDNVVLGYGGGNVGVGDISPSYDLDVSGNMQVTNGSGYHRLYGSGSLYNSGGVYAGTNVTAYNGFVRAGSIGRFYTNDSAAYNPRNDNNICHYSSTWGPVPNDYCAMYASCSSGDVIMGMMTGYTAGMGTAGGWQYVASGFSDQDTGYIVFYSPDDNNSAPTTVYARAVCFSPNG